MEKFKGVVFSTNPDTGQFQSFEIDLPIETYGSVMYWGLDFIRALRERPKWMQWLVRRLMGKWAWRELIGMRDTIEKFGYNTTFEGVGHECPYYQDKVGDL